MGNKTSILVGVRHLFYAFLVAVIFCGCWKVTDSTRVQDETIESDYGTGISIITIDGCEYVWVKRGYGGGLSHKGNCKFCIEHNKINPLTETTNR